MSDKTEKKHTPSETVTAMAAVLKKGVKIGADGISTIDEELYAKTLPEDLPMETFVAVQKHNSTFLAAAGLAFGEVAMATMKKYGKIDQVSAEINMVGKDNLEYTFTRQKNYPNPKTEGETITTYGVLDVKLSTHGARTKVGELGVVRKHLAAEALLALGKG